VNHADRQEHFVASLDAPCTMITPAALRERLRAVATRIRRSSTEHVT
jgi:hypothetical protein